MGQQKIKYQWFRDIPKNVSRHEYEKFLFRSFGSISLGLVSAMLLIVVTTGLTLKESEELSQIESMSIADALDYQGDRINRVKLHGYLVTDTPITMPDDDSGKVIRGSLTISARSGARSGKNDSTETIRETLYKWQKAADKVFLSDGDRRISLAFDLAALPMVDESRKYSVKIIREGESARTSRPVAVQYGEMIFNLDQERWGDSVFTDLERSVLPYGQEVVVVVGLEHNAPANWLIEPLGDRLKVKIGSERQILQQGKELRVLFAFFCIVAGIGSFILWRSANVLHQEFIERSNQ